MYLKKAIIKNFRSLRDVSVEFDNVTILIGENNAGKSTILDAIRIALSKALGKQPFDEYDFFMYGGVKSPKDSDGISITLMFEERIVGEWDGGISDSFIDAFQYVDAEKASIIIGIKASYNESTAEIETKTSFLNNRFETIASKVQNSINKFLLITPVFYLQALREIRDVFSSKSPLWGRFIKKVSIPKNELDLMQGQIKDLNNSIISKDDNLSKLVLELQNIQKVMNLQGDDLVSINAVPIKSWDLLSKAQVVLNNGTSDIDFPLERHGQGTQSVSAILLFKAYVNILLNEISSKLAEAILTLEEPEAHLHPQAIRALYKTIDEMKCQKVITTHSPYFIQNADIRNIRYIKKEKGETYISKINDHICFKVENVTEALIKIAEKFAEVISIDRVNSIVTIHKPINKTIEKSLRGCCECTENNIDEIILAAYSIFSDHELCEINMYIQRNRGDILFARKWVLYEGQTEDVIIPYFAELLGKCFDEHGISGIMYRNNGSAKAFIKLAKVLDISWIVLGDNDSQGKSTINEVKNCGYSDKYVQNRVILTSKKDIEHELADSPIIFEDYKKILGIELPEVEKMSKADTNSDEYKDSIIKRIQEEKVENAYKLLQAWKRRGFSKEEIPLVIKSLIEKV